MKEWNRKGWKDKKQRKEKMAWRNRKAMKKEGRQKYKKNKRK